MSEDERAAGEASAAADSVSPADARPAEGSRQDPSGTSKAAGTGRRRGSRGFLRELPVLIIVALLLALGIKAWLVQAFYIPSESMENTLDIGDRVLVNKVGYHLHPVHRGDVVVFNGLDSWDPETGTSKPVDPFATAVHRVGSWLGFVPDDNDYVKRVIGVPGDTVACCTAGRVTVNGRPLDERSYLHPGDAPSDIPFGPITVQPGQLWVMGDHRERSADSRSHLGDPGGGAIPEDRVVGRAMLRIWPLSRIGTLPEPAEFH